MEKKVIADNLLSVKPNIRLKYNFLTKDILFDPYNDIVRTHMKV